MPRVTTSRVAPPPLRARPARLEVDLSQKTSRSGALLKSGEVFTARLPAGTWNLHCNLGRELVEYRLPGERTFRSLDGWAHGLKGAVELRVTGLRGYDKAARLEFRTEPGRGAIKTFDFNLVVRGPHSSGARAGDDGADARWRPTSTGSRVAIGGDDSGAAPAPRGSTGRRSVGGDGSGARPGRAVGGSGSSAFTPSRPRGGRRSIGGADSGARPLPRGSVGGSGSSGGGGWSWSDSGGGGGGVGGGGS